MTLENRQRHQPGLRRPQFSLRALLLFVGMFCVLLALAKLIGGYATLVLVLFLLTVIAHVAGNAIGMQLRQHDGRHATNEHERAAMGVIEPDQLGEHHFAPATQLSRTQRLGWIVFGCVIFGVCFGGVVGAWLLHWAIAEKSTWANMSVGVIAFGVLGGFFGFLISSFVKVLFDANSEAIRAERNDRAA